MAKKAKFKLVEAPVITVGENDSPTSILMKFYEELGWDGELMWFPMMQSYLW